MPNNKPNRHKFTLYIADGESGTNVTVIGDPETGYSIRNKAPEDHDLPHASIRLYE